MPQPRIEQLAHMLAGDVAFLIADQGVYFARRAQWPPVSPVVRLLQGIWALEPRRAPWIARRRVYATGPATPAAAGAVKVAARSITADLSPVDHQLAIDDPHLD